MKNFNKSLTEGDTPLLQISNLKVHFDTLDGPIEALNDINLEVYKGQIMGVVGESGCGKSVTSLTTIGLATCDVDNGSIKYDGREMIFKSRDDNNYLYDISTKLLTFFAVFILLPLGSIYLMPFMKDPLFGFKLLMLSLLLLAISMVIKFYTNTDERKHNKFMRFIRGNEISMIFQEPMTALNPLYTVEKQIFEVMKAHSKLPEASMPKAKKLFFSLLSPFVHLNNFTINNKSGALTFLLLVSIYIFFPSAEDHIMSSFYLIILLGYAPPIVKILLKGNNFNSYAAWHSILITTPFSFVTALIFAALLWTPFPVVATVVVLFLSISTPLMIIIDYLKLDPSHRDEIIRILEEVRIPNPNSVIMMYPHELSGGMRQRVMIAMMMSCEPKLLIADEPTTALDVTIQAQILKLMRDLRDKKGTAIMLITHDLGVIAEMCDEVAVMYAGRVVEQAPVSEIFANPRHAYTKGLLASSPSMSSERKSTLTAIPGQVSQPSDFVQGCRFCQRMGREGQTLEIRPKIRHIGNKHWVEDCQICVSN